MTPAKHVPAQGAGYDLARVRADIDDFEEDEDEGTRVCQLRLCLDVLLYYRGALRENREGLAAFYEAALKLVGPTATYALVDGRGRFRKATKAVLEMFPFWLSPKSPERDEYGLMLESGAQPGEMSDRAFQMYQSGDDPGYVRLVLPVEFLQDGPEAFAGLVRTLARPMRLLCGSAGFAVNMDPNYPSWMPDGRVHRISRRHAGVDLGQPHLFADFMTAGIKCVNWITLLGDDLLAKAGGAAHLTGALGEDARVVPLDHGAMIVAGVAPAPGHREPPRGHGGLPARRGRAPRCARPRIGGGRVRRAGGDGEHAAVARALRPGGGRVTTLDDGPRPPFALGWRVPPAELIGRLRVTVDGEPGTDIEQHVGGVEMFADAAAAQAFTATDVLTTMDEAARAVDAGGARAWIEYDVAALPADALMVLTALLAQTHHAGAPLVRVTYAMAGAARDGWPPPVARARALVPRVAPPFALSWPDDPVPDAPVDVTIELADEAPPELASLAGRVLATWGYVVGMGGFLVSWGEQEEFTPDFGETAQLAPRVLRYVKEPFCGSAEEAEAAANALVNCLAGLHRRGHRIESVAVEQ
jgi:hypothetical protein